MSVKVTNPVRCGETVVLDGVVCDVVSEVAGDWTVLVLRRGTSSRVPESVHIERLGRIVSVKVHDPLWGCDAMRIFEVVDGRERRRLRSVAEINLAEGWVDELVPNVGRSGYQVDDSGELVARRRGGSFVMDLSKSDGDLVLRQLWHERSRAQGLDFGPYWVPEDEQEAA